MYKSPLICTFIVKCIRFYSVISRTIPHCSSRPLACFHVELHFECGCTNAWCWPAQSLTPHNPCDLWPLSPLCMTPHDTPTPSPGWSLTHLCIYAALLCLQDVSVTDGLSDIVPAVSSLQPGDLFDVELSKIDSSLGISVTVLFGKVFTLYIS